MVKQGYDLPSVPFFFFTFSFVIIRHSTSEPMIAGKTDIKRQWGADGWQKLCPRTATALAGKSIQ